jgi:hypothetical protein
VKLLPLILALVWLKGNLHTHTIESDGDVPPAEVAQWYQARGYDFLVITDHDKITRIEHPGILLIPGEEVTDLLPKKPLHVNALGLERVVKPQGASTPVENLQRNIDAVRAAGGVPLVNHPNFGWAFGASELAQLKNAVLFEIASGHPLINADGPPSTEEMWDELLTGGKRWYGVAVDDSHHFKCPPPAIAALPGQAWVVVRAEKADAKLILEALERGDFYSSTGPAIDDYAVTDKTMTVTIRTHDALSAPRHRTEFDERESGRVRVPRGRALRAREGDGLEREEGVAPAGIHRWTTISVTLTGRAMASTIRSATSSGSMNPSFGGSQNGVCIPPGATDITRAFVPFASAFSTSV